MLCHVRAQGLTQAQADALTAYVGRIIGTPEVGWWCLDGDGGGKTPSVCVTLVAVWCGLCNGNDGESSDTDPCGGVVDTTTGTD